MATRSRLFAVPCGIPCAVAISALVISCVGLVAVVVLRKVKTGKFMPFSPVVGLLMSIWSWTIFSGIDPLLRYAIPALHSIQYLFFVYLLGKNKARAEEGAPKFGRPVAVRLAFLTMGALALTSLLPALKKTRHQVNVECPAGLSFETYPGAIYQIVVNLVMNSITHGFEGMDTGHIRIVATPLDGQLTLSYSDDGRGMNEETRKRVFEPFFTTRRGEGGSGLGLHIAYNLATQVLRGTIVVESSPGKGVRFTVKFPIESRAVA